jgi:phosphoserine phosphatase RsbU/P
LLRKEKQKIERLQKDGIALGVVPDAKYFDRQITLNHNDFLLLYTDGVTEAFSTEGEIFSEERLAETLLQSTSTNANDLLASIELKINEFRNGEPPSDDLTMIAVQRNR